MIYYCNCGGLEVWDEEENDWCDWYYDDGDNYFDDIDEYIEAMYPMSNALKAAQMEMANQVTFN